MLFTQTIKSQNVAKPHSSGEETLWHNKRTCPDGGLHCGIGSHCLTDSCRKNEEEEEDIVLVLLVSKDPLGRLTGPPCALKHDMRIMLWIGRCQSHAVACTHPDLP